MNSFNNDDERHGYGEQLCCEKCGWYQHITEGKCVNKKCQAPRKYLSIPMDDWHPDTWNGDKSEVGQQIQGTKAEIEADLGLGTATSDGLYPLGYSVIRERHDMLLKNNESNHALSCNDEGRKHKCKVCTYNMPFQCSVVKSCRCAKCVLANAHQAKGRMFKNVFYNEKDPEIIGKDYQRSTSFVFLDSMDDEDMFQAWKMADKNTSMKVTVYDDFEFEFDELRAKAIKNKEAKDIRELQEQNWVNSGHARSELIPEDRKKWYYIWMKKYSSIIETAFGGMLEIIEHPTHGRTFEVPDDMSTTVLSNFTWELKSSNGDQAMIIATVAKYIIPLLQNPIEEDPWADNNMVCGLKGCDKVRAPKEISCIKDPINFKSLTTYDEMIDKKETMRKEMEDKDRKEMEIIRQTYWSKTE